MLAITPGMYLLGGFGVLEKTGFFFSSSGFYTLCGVGMWTGQERGLSQGVSAGQGTDPH